MSSQRVVMARKYKWETRQHSQCDNGQHPWERPWVWPWLVATWLRSGSSRDYDAQAQAPREEAGLAQENSAHRFTPETTTCQIQQPWTFHREGGKLCVVIAGNWSNAEDASRPRQQTGEVPWEPATQRLGTEGRCPKPETKISLTGMMEEFTPSWGRRIHQ